MGGLIVLAIAIASPLFILLLGILPLRQKLRGPAVAAELAAHAIAWGIILFGFLVWVPKFKRIFQDFGTELNAATQILIRCSDIVHLTGTIAFTVPVAAILTVDGVVFHLLWRDPSQKSLRILWSLAMTALPMVVLVLSEISILFPMISVLNDLS